MNTAYSQVKTPEYADATNTQTRAEFRAELTLKSVWDGFILLETNMQIHTSSKKTNTQNLHKLVAVVSN